MRDYEREEGQDRYGEIYAARKKNGRRIKFGFSVQAEIRVKALASDGPTILLARVRGWLSDEKRLHAALAEHRHYHEWYKPSRQILDLVTLMQDGITIEALLEKAARG